MSRIILKVLAPAVGALILGSCAATAPGISGAPWETGDDLAPVYPSMPSDRVLVITGKARLDLPKYRVRGTCRITRWPSGDVRVDFVHSSLFGSYREDVTIYIAEDEIMLQDNEGGICWNSDSTLALLERHLGMAVRADDLSYCLLFDFPRIEGHGAGPAGTAGRYEWRSEGAWRGRQVAVEGTAGIGPSMFRQCVDNENNCYLTRYDYGRKGPYSGYPEKIVLEREYGTERISLAIVSVTDDTLTAWDSR